MTRTEEIEQLQLIDIQYFDKYILLIRVSECLCQLILEEERSYFKWYFTTDSSLQLTLK